MLGIGSEFRGDDASGVLVAARLIDAKISSRAMAVKIFVGATAPENLTGEIKRFKPTHLLIIDTVDAGQKPGTVLVLDPEVTGGATFSTHTMPARVLADYLHNATRCKTVIIGIQGKTMEFGDTMTPAVKKAALFVCDELIGMLRGKLS